MAAASGGAGKTMLSLGLARACRNQGLRVKPFKKGPDYIDAAWLAAAAGEPTTNLDPFFLEPGQIRRLFSRSMRASHADLGIIEGNRGLYDGLNESGSCSTANVARAVKAPILLCIDCRKVTRTAAALINGLVSFEKNLDFVGVVLNRIGSARHETSLRAAISANSDLPVLGCLPRLPGNLLPERHMGLACAGDGLAQDLEEKLERIAAFVQENCDVAGIIACARSAPELGPDAEPPVLRPPAEVTIGVVRDKALWFYYPENLEALENAGARLRYLSLFTDSQRALAEWRELDGLYLGGGFPEDYCEEIAASPCLAVIKTLALRGMPIYAECGGLIILASEFRRGDTAFRMADVFPTAITWSDAPVGLGYVEANVCRDNPWYARNQIIKGHEFHYSQASAGGSLLALSRGAGPGKRTGRAMDGFCVNRVWAGYTHIFAPALPEWACAFVRLAKEYKSGSAANSDHLDLGDSSPRSGSEDI